nr:hypothetical protein [Tanacetum cinerariifolium]
MNSVHSKKDYVIGISKSVFVTNFPDYFGSHDLQSLCEAYGKVVDVFIPNRKSKAGKRLRLLGSSGWMIWIVSLIICARFGWVVFTSKLTLCGMSVPLNLSHRPGPHYEGSVFCEGKVKVLSSIANLYIILNKEGFADLQISYIGGSWVRIDLASDKSKNKLLLHKGVLLWFDVLKAATNDFVSSERIAWVDIERIPLYLCKKWRDVVDIEESVGSSLARKRICVKTSRADNILESFQVVFKGRIFLARAKELFTWTPSFLEYKEEDYNLVDDSVLGDHNNMANILHGHNGKGGGQESEDKGVSETIFGDNIKSSPCTNQNESQSAFVQQSDDPFGLNDLLDKPSISRVNELDPSLSHPPGFTPDPSQHVHRDSSPVQHNVNPVESLHEESSSPLSKVEVNCHANEAHSVDFSSEASTHIHSRITAKGGSFLDVLDDMIKNGETVVLGDFNEVRSEEERFGSIFNQSCARDFNCFISSSGLVDVKMEGFSFRWVHPWAKKMSKLDRFLVSDGIILGFPAITAVCLDRHLSDHHPILLNEIHTDFGPTPLIRLKKKLQDLKSVIRSWVRDSNDTLVGSKNSILKTLGDIDKALDNGSVSDELLVKRMELLNKYHELKQLDSKDAVQKAKVMWAIEGDENSKFFHGIINKKRSQLAIRGVFVNGDWHTEPSLVKDTILDHFSNRFKQPSSSRFKLSLPFLSRLSSDQVLDLDKNISSDEIHAAVWDCGENKSPGPDGYTFEIFRRYWNVIVDAKLVTDFRPISLIGSVYKVVTKILANRVATVISDLVSNTQSAFVVKRRILDGPFILNEVLSWCKRKRKQALVFKVNFAKAYDYVRPTAEFPMCCGLKQGDPLALLLFILVMETLHISISGAVNEGLRINVSKSQVLGIGVPSDIVQQGASRIGCDIMKTPFKYLGVMVGDNMSRLSAWSNSIQKIHAKLSKWKVKTLSIGGRLTLLKSVLGATPVYNMSILKPLYQFFMRWKCFGIISLLEVTLRVRIRDGLNTRFWLDVWLLDMPLCACFPCIFALENNIDASVAVKQGAPSLDASFRRPVRDGVERSQLEDLVSLVGGISLSVSADRWVCDLTGDGEFRVRDIRTTLDNLFLPSSVVATRWVKHVSIKVNIFAWRARLNRLPTRGNLISRGVLLDSSYCLNCDLATKDSHHLFLRCDLAKSIAQKLCRWWSIQWVDVLYFEDGYSSFSSIRLPVKLKAILEGVFFTSWWHL